MNGIFIYFAWLISLTGGILSVYFGEILGFIPCPLCWYQRMCLFALIVLLGMGIYRGDRTVSLYGIAFSLFGFLFALYQILEGHFPILQQRILCRETQQCSEPVFFLLGFIDFPLLSAIGFLFIASLLCLGLKKGNSVD